MSCSVQFDTALFQFEMSLTCTVASTMNMDDPNRIRLGVP